MLCDSYLIEVIDCCQCNFLTLQWGIWDWLFHLFVCSYSLSLFHPCISEESERKVLNMPWVESLPNKIKECQSVRPEELVKKLQCFFWYRSHIWISTFVVTLVQLGLSYHQTNAAEEGIWHNKINQTRLLWEKRRWNLMYEINTNSSAYILLLVKTTNNLLPWVLDWWETSGAQPNWLVGTGRFDRR